MSIFIPRSTRYRYSVQACEENNSYRNYDCKNCEHFHVDCSLGDKIEQAIKTDDFSHLPEYIHEKIIFNTFSEHLEESQKLIKAWNDKRLNQKRLP